MMSRIDEVDSNCIMSKNDQKYRVEKEILCEMLFLRLYITYRLLAEFKNFCIWA